MPQGGRLKLATYRSELNEAEARQHPQARAGSFIVLEVSDNGPGMSQEVADQVFEPFSTTKEVGHGTGLGLATVNGIVSQHDG